jgi:hypothetical protein
LQAPEPFDREEADQVRADLLAASA